MRTTVVIWFTVVSWKDTTVQDFVAYSYFFKHTAVTAHGCCGVIINQYAMNINRYYGMPYYTVQY